MIKTLTRASVLHKVERQKRKGLSGRMAKEATPFCIFYCAPDNCESTNKWNDLIDGIY